MRNRIPSLVPLTAFKKLSFLAAASLFLSATAPATTIQFNPTLPLDVVNQGGFVGTYNPPQNYTRAIVSFEFSLLNPSPLASSFFITNIKLAGDGITGSLSFANLEITGNDFFSTAAVNLSTPTSSLNFVNSLVSFDVPANVINPDAEFAISIQYRNNNGTQVNTSDIVLAPTYEAVPEPSTYALLALTAAGLVAHRWRKRSKVRG